MSVEELLDERERTHGSFYSNSANFDRLVRALPLEGFDSRVRYAVVGIFVKLARMHSGEGLFRGHWEDIEGYARKVVELIDEESEP